MIAANSPLFSSGKDDWETPDDFFQTYDQLYHFVLDAAANETNHKCDKWYGPGGVLEDALTAKWPIEQGNIWLNPPYSRGLQGRFVRKALEEVRRPGYYHGNSVVCLLPARTDTKLFHEVILPHAEITFVKGRVRFKNREMATVLRPAEAERHSKGKKILNNSAPFPSMIVVF